MSNNDMVIDSVSKDNIYYTVNPSRDLGMVYKELIGKKVRFIKITKSGLYQVVDIENKKIYSLPKTNLSSI